MRTLMRALFRRPAPDPVARGVALLDREHPRWYAHVDPDELDMGSNSRCVLGQIYGGGGYSWGYIYGRDDLGLSHRSAVRHGFDIRDNRNDVGYADLTKQWAAVIRDRQANAKAADRAREAADRVLAALATEPHNS
jgi:hypothetical protein